MIAAIGGAFSGTLSDSYANGSPENPRPSATAGLIILHPIPSDPANANFGRFKTESAHV